MISVLTWSYNRQKMFDITLPLWLKQEGVDFEVIAGHGPEVKVIPDSRIKPVYTPDLAMCKAYNDMLAVASGDMILITQADMQVNSPTQLKRMLDNWSPYTMVTERFFKDGKRDCGMYLQFMLVAKEDIIKAGGWHEEYDKGSYAYEDTDFVACMLENGLNFNIIETPEDEGVYHIHHERPDLNDERIKTRIAKARAIYDSRHKDTIMGLYAKQIGLMLTKKRAGQIVCPK